MNKNLLITGGAGFIGSHVIRLFVKKYPDYHIVNLDALTYDGELENLRDIEDNDNYTFVKADINELDSVLDVMKTYEIDGIIHLAAESHVDRSISDPLAFIRTNIVGTYNLLHAAVKMWADKKNKLFYHVSTDEVYGSLGEDGLFTEDTSYDPKSPYSASKASSDHFVRAFSNTYQLPVVISNCSNNYGPNQFPEKIIPLMINNILEKRKLPVYGKGENVRDWLYVKDHATAIDSIFHNGKRNHTYNIGGLNEWSNINLVQHLCKLVDQKIGRSSGESEKLIEFVTDRPGHDKRYAIDASKIMSELGWKPSVTFEEGLSETVDWYLENASWLSNVTSGAYMDYYKEHYKR
jgi:dTDP-glucose 4,6-dehydratase